MGKKAAKSENASKKRPKRTLPETPTSDTPWTKPGWSFDIAGLAKATDETQAKKGKKGGLTSEGSSPTAPKGRKKTSS